MILRNQDFEFLELFIKQSLAGDPLFKSKADSASFKEEIKGIVKVRDWFSHYSFVVDDDVQSSKN